MTREDFEALGDMHKRYEKLAVRYLMPNMPIMIRLDGRAFHTFTKGLKRPYDVRFSKCMVEATKELIHQTNAVIAYTQSDEISLIIDASADPIFGGRVSKIESVLAATASIAFYKALLKYLPEKAESMPVFDCRAWQYPTINLYVDSLRWRECDATRNSLTMACASQYKQKELQNVGSARQHDMLMDKGINWNNYPAFFKRGSYFAKRQVSAEMDDETWNKIPDKNKPESRLFVRNVIVHLDCPPVDKVRNMMLVVYTGDYPMDANKQYTTPLTDFDF